MIPRWRLPSGFVYKQLLVRQFNITGVSAGHRDKEEGFIMLCPRCGNEWDPTKGACMRCGFVIRTTGNSGSLPVFPNSSQKSNPPPEGFSSTRQQSGGLPRGRQQPGGFPTPLPPGVPHTVPSPPSTSLPPQNSPFGSNESPLTPDGAFPKPAAFEKQTLRKMPPGREQGMQQAGGAATPESFKTGVRNTPQPPNRSTDHLQQDLGRPQTQPLQRRTHQLAADPSMQNVPNPQGSRPATSFQQASGRAASMRTDTISPNMRPLLPGTHLRGGRYRLQELRERQDWLSGVFEAFWIGKDAQRAGSQVTICEVVLPESTSVMTQTMLRTATMALASVGRHPHIPTLWDAFSDQGRGFFVFEPIMGDSLIALMRYSGRALPEQEVIECCLQMTDVLELLAQQSPQLVHGLVRPEHIVVARNGSHYVLTNFSVVLAGGATQYIAGLERSRISPYAPPEFARGVVDVRTDLYALIATAYHAVTGSVPTGISGSIPQAQRINPNISPAFDAILTKGLRAVANQRYQRPSELRQDLLLMRSVKGTLASSSSKAPFENSISSLVSRNGQSTQRPPDTIAQALPILLNPTDEAEERAPLLPRPEDLPPMKEGNDVLSAAFLLGLILVSFIIIVVLSHMFA